MPSVLPPRDQYMPRIVDEQVRQYLGFSVPSKWLEPSGVARLGRHAARQIV